MLTPRARMQGETTMADLTPLQQAVAYQALYGALGPVVKAGGDGLRGQVDAELKEIYERTGAKTYKVQVDGVALGTYTVTESKAVPESEKVVYDLVDEGWFTYWAKENVDMLTEYALQQGEGFVRWVVENYGEVPDGVDARTVTIPAQPASYKGGQIRVDKGFQAEVTRRMQEGLAALVAPASALLAEGE